MDSFKIKRLCRVNLAFLVPCLLGGCTGHLAFLAAEPPQTTPATSAQQAPSGLVDRDGANLTREFIAKKPQTVSQVSPGEKDAKPAGSIEELYRRAAESYKKVKAYVVRFRRREEINGKKMPEELILFKFRQEPFSVYMKWLGETAQNREVIFVQGQHNNQLHTLTAAGDVPFVPAGRRMSFAVDSFLVRSNSRHPITEAGVGKTIESFGQLLQALKQGKVPKDSVKYLGLTKRPEYQQPLEAVLQIIPAGYEKTLPRGGKRQWFFDLVHHFPVLVITHDDRDNVVEYYCLDRFIFLPQLSDDEFNPDIVFRRAGGKDAGGN